MEMNQLELYPENVTAATQVLFVNFGAREAAYCLRLAAKLREAGIRTELYPDAVKMKKQMAYADKKGIRFVAIVGEDEIKDNSITVKNMLQGEQKTLSIDEVINLIRTSV